MRRAISPLALLLLAGCSGLIVAPVPNPDDVTGGAGGGAVEPVCMPTGEVAPAPMLRLTRAQLDNVTRDALGSTFQPSSLLPTDERVGPFAANALTSMTQGLAEQYEFVAEAIGDEVEAAPLRFAPCANARVDGHACADTFVTSLGQRLFRHALLPDEHDRWLALYDTQAADAGYAGGVRAVVEGMLQSPSTLYRVEPLPPGADPATPDAWPLDGAALATRLSFLLWNSGPDDALLQQAASGALTADALPAAVDRMLSDPRATNANAAFAEGWAGINLLGEAASSPGRLGPLDPSIIPVMHDDTVGFVDRALRTPDSAGALATLFTTRAAPPAAALAAYATADQRSGILSNASVLFTHAHSEQTSPVLRGRWLRENILCQPIPDPPPTVVAVPPPPQPGQTTRERFESHRTDPSCATCHKFLDDVGFGFEAFDQYGRHRDTDSGKSVDDTGTLVGTDIDGSFKGVVELGTKLSSSKLAAQCFARQWFRFGLGHDSSPRDVCTLQTMSKAIGAGGEGFAASLHTLVQSEAFTTRRSPAP